MKNILIVDDSDLVRQLFREILSGIGYRVYEAATARKALEVAGRFPPDLVFIEYNLPRTNGVETASLLRQLPKQASTPMILLTSNQDLDGCHIDSIGMVDGIMNKVTVSVILEDCVKKHLENTLIENLRAGENYRETVAAVHDNLAHLIEAYNRFGLDHLKQDSPAKERFDSLEENVLFVETDGTIAAVNRSWTRFADQNNAPPEVAAGAGINYFEICRNSSAPNAAEAEYVSQGLRAVIGGMAGQFVMEYPCYSPVKKAWFIIVCERVNGGAVIAHQNITNLKVIH